MSKFATLGILLLLLITLVANSQSQPQSVLFTYGRKVNDSFERLLIIDNGEPTRYVFPSSMCGATSPNGQLIVRALVENPTKLEVYSLLEDRILFSIPWQPNWMPCTISWNYSVYYTVDIDYISVKDISDPTLNTVAARFEYKNGVLVPVIQAPRVVTPDLPFYYEEGDRIYIASPDNTKFVYLKCRVFTQYCEEGDYVIYDSVSQQDLYVFGSTGDLDKKADVVNLFGDKIRVGPSSRSPYYAWSRDSRYFMYPIYAITGSPSVSGFAIYDTISQTHVVINDAPYRLDFELRPKFSSDSTKVAFWIEGFVGEDDDIITREELDRLNTLYIYDLETNEYRFVESPFDLGGANWEVITWSPNTDELVFIADFGVDSGNLYRVNANTANAIVFDTNVTRLTAWTFIEPVPVISLATPTPLPTQR
jgi:hypothetical protein